MKRPYLIYVDLNTTPDHTTGDNLVTTAEYAQKHGLHIETVRRRIKKNKIKAELQPDNTYIIIEDWLPNQKSEQTTPNSNPQHHTTQQEPTTSNTTPDHNTQQPTAQQLIKHKDDHIQELTRRLRVTESNLAKLTDDMVEERKRTDTIIMTQTQTIDRQSEKLDNLRLKIEE